MGEVRPGIRYSRPDVFEDLKNKVFGGVKVISRAKSQRYETSRNGKPVTITRTMWRIQCLGCGKKIVTQTSNIKKNTHGCKACANRVTDHGFKLSLADAITIRVKRELGISVEDLSIEYKVSRQHIYNILDKKYWRADAKRIR